MAKAAMRLSDKAGKRHARTALTQFLVLKYLGVDEHSPRSIRSQDVVDACDALFGVAGDDLWRWYDVFRPRWQSDQGNGGWPVGTIDTQLKRPTERTTRFVKTQADGNHGLAISFAESYVDELASDALLSGSMVDLADLGAWLMRLTVLDESRVDQLGLPEYLRQEAISRLHLTSQERTLFGHGDPTYELSDTSTPEELRRALPKPEVSPQEEAVRRGVSLPQSATMSSDLAVEAYRLLQAYQNVVLHGPPGTGKTFAALQVQEMWQEMHGPDAVLSATFHPSYAYEDFIEGFRPSRIEPSKFVLTPGLLLRASERADAKGPTLLILDEINRADLARVFGEAITYIESDKRGLKFVTSQNPDLERHISPMLYLLGTMNTADKSISLMDIAFRRRFKFVESPPDPSAFSTIAEWRDQILDVPMADLLLAVNGRLKDRGVGDDRLIGQALLAVRVGEPDDVLADRLRYDVLPLVQEYMYGDVGQVRSILPGLLDEAGRVTSDRLTRQQLIGLIEPAPSELDGNREPG